MATSLDTITLNSGTVGQISPRGKASETLRDSVSSPVASATPTRSKTTTSGGSRLHPRRRRPSNVLKHSTGLAVRRIPSLAAQLESGAFQYNGPHFTDVEDVSLELKHGVHKDSVLRLDGHIKTVLYSPRIRAYTVLHSGGICRFVNSTLDEDLHDTCVTDDIDKLLYAVDFGVYVGVCRQRLKLLNKTFEVLFEVETPRKITASSFNSWSDKVVTGSLGSIMVRGRSLTFSRFALFGNVFSRYGGSARVQRS